MKRIAFAVSLVVFLLLAACNQAPGEDLSSQGPEYGQVRLNVLSDYRDGAETTNFNGKFDKGEFLLPNFEVRLTPINEQGEVIGEPLRYLTNQATDLREGTVLKVPVGIYQPELVLPTHLQGGDEYAWQPVGPTPIPLPPIFVKYKGMFDGLYSIACGFGGRMFVEIRGFDEYPKTPCFQRFPEVGDGLSVRLIPGSNTCGFIKALVTVHYKSGRLPTPVTLSVSNLPAGMIESFNPNPTSTQSTLTLGMKYNLTPGTYQIMIHDSRGYSVPLTVTVNGPVFINVPDVNLEAAIKTTLNLPAFLRIANGDMLSLTDLAAPANNIANLQGLECAENLKTLDLQDNTVSDLTPLANLKKLESLNLDLNSVNDVGPLSGLTKLKTLFVSRNMTLSDLTPLAGLTKLEFLELNRNAISDLRPLSGLTSLTFLALQVNQISDLTPLQGLYNVKLLDIGVNKVSDLSPLQGLQSLEILRAQINSISDPAPLVNLPNLQEVDVQFNPISNFQAISDLQMRGVSVWY